MKVKISQIFFGSVSSSALSMYQPAFLHIMSGIYFMVWSLSVCGIDIDPFLHSPLSHFDSVYFFLSSGCSACISKPANCVSANYESNVCLFVKKKHYYLNCVYLHALDSNAYLHKLFHKHDKTCLLSCLL